MDEYATMRVIPQYDLENDTNILYFHTQVQFDAFWSVILHTNFHKHQTIDWTYILNEPCLTEVEGMFRAVGLHDFLAHRCDYNEIIIRQFYATVEFDLEEKSLKWMTGKRKYAATFVEFAEANLLDYNFISNGADLVGADNFEDIAQYYEPARLGLSRSWSDSGAEASSCCDQQDC